MAGQRWGARRLISLPRASLRGRLLLNDTLGPPKHPLEAMAGAPPQLDASWRQVEKLIAALQQVLAQVGWGARGRASDARHPPLLPPFRPGAAVPRFRRLATTRRRDCWPRQPPSPPPQPPQPAAAALADRELSPPLMLQLALAADDRQFAELAEKHVKPREPLPPRPSRA